MSNIKIVYTVSCTTDCAKVSSSVSNLGTKNIQNILNTINLHGQNMNLGLNMVTPTSAKQVLSVAPPPLFVDIIIPKCPSGTKAPSTTMASMI